MSKAGRRVRLTLDRGSYPGARPYYTVAYLKPSGSPQTLRYTPFLDRAEFLFERFREDVIDPTSVDAGPGPSRRPRRRR